MKRRLVVTLVVVALFWIGILAARAGGDALPNTGMADPLALVSAYDRLTAGVAVVLSLSNLRGVSGEDINAGGQVTVDLTTGAVDSTVQLLPLGERSTSSPWAQ